MDDSTNMDDSKTVDEGYKVMKQSRGLGFFLAQMTRNDKPMQQNQGQADDPRPLAPPPKPTMLQQVDSDVQRPEPKNWNHLPFKSQPQMSKESQPAAYNSSYGEEASTNSSLKREYQAGGAVGGKRHCQDWDSDQFMSRDFSNLDDDMAEVVMNGAYCEGKNKLLAEEYGPFIQLKYLKGQCGKVGYYCELCDAECNAMKTLQLHCSGMKHMKKCKSFKEAQEAGDTGWNHSAEGRREPLPEHYSKKFEPVVSKGGNSRSNDWDQRDERYAAPRPLLPSNSSGLPKRPSSIGYEQPRMRWDYEHQQPHGPSQDGPVMPPRVSMNLQSKEGLSTSPMGPLIRRLADCSIKDESDAILASDVVSLLLPSLHDYYREQGCLRISQALMEAERNFKTSQILISGVEDSSNSMSAFIQSLGSKPDFSQDYY